MRINIQWQGPHSKEYVTQKLSRPSDYGVYQLYGRHPTYGAKTLLYIGKARDRPFSQRISEHNFDDYVCGTADVLVGRLSYFGAQPNDWEERIDRVESLLIYAHHPAWNSNFIVDYPTVDNLHILNWGDYGLLLPEVSNARYKHPDNRLPDSLTIFSDE